MVIPYCTTVLESLLHRYSMRSIILLNAIVMEIPLMLRVGISIARMHCAVMANELQPSSWRN